MKKVMAVLLCLSLFGGISYSSASLPDFLSITVVGLEMPARDLFDERNFNAGVKLEASAMRNGIFTGVLSLTNNDGRKIARLTISVSQGYDGLNYIREISFTNLISGEKDATRYDGSQYSLGRILGYFIVVGTLFYN
ncbi:MAG: hypothetical protein LBC07_04715 [Elusimicrobiota bacterium]|jgi:hypothetical protein|nr:hypothetical protein [Elusimicrobiota bacterium]